MSMFVKRAMLAVLPLLSAFGGGVELMSEAMFMGQANDNKAIDRGFDAKPLTNFRRAFGLIQTAVTIGLLTMVLKGTWMRGATLWTPCVIHQRSAIL